MTVSRLPSDDTIVAIATPPGSGAIAVIRLSGPHSLKIISSYFTPFRRKEIFIPESHRSYFGTLRLGNEIIDEVIVTWFKEPSSYTGEETIEIACHGSVFIQQTILNILIDGGARMANPGEFTLRAFLNGKMDLSQAEAVADLIASQSQTAHHMAVSQMRGGFSNRINELRNELLHFTSLMELELDFGEEDVEFADRSQLRDLLNRITESIEYLIESFNTGNVLKKGIPVAIIGKPNAGKSTLLNAILNEEKALVSDIPGTTRDAIEDAIVIQGYTFRFIDTAGLRESVDKVENMGIARTYTKMDEAAIILYVCDISHTTENSIREILAEFQNYISSDHKHFLLVANKIDQMEHLPGHLREIFDLDTVFVSAKRKENIHTLAEKLVSLVKQSNIGEDILVNNSRHYEALTHALTSIQQAREGVDSNLSVDLIAIDIRQALYSLGSITGVVTTDEILGNIFSKFCIGK